jgi:hypothetical protein
MSYPLCLNDRRFLIMNNKIKNAVVKLDSVSGQQWPLSVHPSHSSYVTYMTHFIKPI